MIESLGEEEGLEEFKVGNKILLLDADTVVFAACSTHEYAEDLLPRDMYSDSEWEAITNEPGYDETEGCVWYYLESEVMSSCINRITTILPNFYKVDSGIMCG